jgi:hypothetical protein
MKMRSIVSWDKLIVAGRQKPVRCRTQQLCCPECEREKQEQANATTMPTG